MDTSKSQTPEHRNPVFDNLLLWIAIGLILGFVVYETFKALHDPLDEYDIDGSRLETPLPGCD